MAEFKTLTLTHDRRLLTITMNRPESLNAIGPAMHEELSHVFEYAAQDPDSDVVLLTGAGRAFSAGGDIDHIARLSEDPSLFAKDLDQAKKIVFSLLDLEKPIVAKVNGHAIGLGATLALFCDVIFAAEDAKIADPHVAIGLVAGDGGAIVWPHAIGFPRAKEFLLTGEALTGRKAAEIGLINHAMPRAALDETVDGFCRKLISGATEAIRWTKVLANIELKRIAHALMDPGLASEQRSVNTEHHREAVRAMQEKLKTQQR